MTFTQALFKHKSSGTRELGGRGAIALHVLVQGAGKHYVLPPPVLQWTFNKNYKHMTKKRWSVLFKQFFYLIAFLATMKTIFI